MLGHAAVVESVCRTALAERAGVVVDIACGTGLLLRSLASDGCRIGVDNAGDDLRRARDLKGGNDCRWVHADARQLPFGDASVDLVTLMSAWWVLPDIERCLAEMARILRPGGVLLVHSWAQASQCRLITLGASVIGARLPAMRRPAGVIGPFEVDVARIGAAGHALGLAVRASAEYEYAWTIAGLDEYWGEFAALAPTSYGAYRCADRPARAAVDTLIEKLLPKVAQGRLGLRWHLTTLSKLP